MISAKDRLRKAARDLRKSAMIKRADAYTLEAAALEAEGFSECTEDEAQAHLTECEKACPNWFEPSSPKGAAS